METQAEVEKTNPKNSKVWIEFNDNQPIQYYTVPYYIKLYFTVVYSSVKILYYTKLFYNV